MVACAVVLFSPRTPNLSFELGAAEDECGGIALIFIPPKPCEKPGVNPCTDVISTFLL